MYSLNFKKKKKNRSQTLKNSLETFYKIKALNVFLSILASENRFAHKTRELRTFSNPDNAIFVHSNAPKSGLNNCRFGKGLHFTWYPKARLNRSV